MLKFLIATALILTCVTQVTAKPRVVAKAGDWEIACEGKTIDCYVTQSVKYDGVIQAIFVGFPFVADGMVAALTVALPQNALLEPGITILIDGKTKLHYNYSACEISVCMVQMGLSQKTLNAYRHGRTGELYFYLKTSPGLRRILRFSLIGFSSAFTEVEKRSGPYSAGKE